ncbi:hypothetical protein CSUI_002481, partial [Cystoisospora suis]
MSTSMPWSLISSPSLVSSSSSSPKSIQPLSFARQALSYGSTRRTFLFPFFLFPLLAFLSLLPLLSSASSFSACRLLHDPLPHNWFFSSFPRVLSHRYQRQELKAFKYTPLYYSSLSSPHNLRCPFSSSYSSFSFTPCSSCPSPLFIAPKLPFFPSAVRLSQRKPLYCSSSFLQSSFRQSTWSDTSLLKSTGQPPNSLRADRLQVEITENRKGEQEKKRKAGLKTTARQEMKKEEKVPKTGETLCPRRGQSEETTEQKGSSSGACRGFLFSWPASIVQEEEIRSRKSRKHQEGDGETKGAWERGRRRTENEEGEEGNGKNGDYCGEEVRSIKRHDEENNMGEKREKEVDNKKRAERRMQSRYHNARGGSLPDVKGIRRLIPKRKRRKEYFRLWRTCEALPPPSVVAVSKALSSLTPSSPLHKENQVYVLLERFFYHIVNSIWNVLKVGEEKCQRTLSHKRRNLRTADALHKTRLPSHDRREQEENTEFFKLSDTRDEEEEKTTQANQDKEGSTTGDRDGERDDTNEVTSGKRRGDASSSTLPFLDTDSQLILVENAADDPANASASLLSTSPSGPSCRFSIKEDNGGHPAGTTIVEEGDTGRDKDPQCNTRLEILSHFLHYLHMCLPSFTRLHRRRLKRRMKIVRSLLVYLDHERMGSSTSPFDSSQTKTHRLSFLDRYVPLTSISYSALFDRARGEQGEGGKDYFDLFSPLPGGYSGMCPTSPCLELRQRKTNSVGNPLYVPSALKIQRRACNLLKALSTASTPQLATTLIRRLLQLPLSASSQIVLHIPHTVSPSPLSSSPASSGTAHTPFSSAGHASTADWTSSILHIPTPNRTASMSSCSRCLEGTQFRRREEGLDLGFSPSPSPCSVPDNYLPSPSLSENAALEHKQDTGVSLQSQKQEEGAVGQGLATQQNQSPLKPASSVSILESETLAAAVYLLALLHAQRVGACTAGRSLWIRIKQLFSSFGNKCKASGSPSLSSAGDVRLLFWRSIVFLLKSKPIVQEALLAASWALSRAGKDPEEAEEVLTLFPSYSELQEGEVYGLTDRERHRRKGRVSSEGIFSLVVANVMEAYIRRQRVAEAVLWGLHLLRRLGILSEKAEDLRQLGETKETKARKEKQPPLHEDTHRILRYPSSVKTASPTNAVVQPEVAAGTRDPSSFPASRDNAAVSGLSPEVLGEEECSGAEEQEEEEKSKRTPCGPVLLPEHAVAIERLLLALSLEGKAREALAVFRLTYRGLVEAIDKRWVNVLRQPKHSGICPGADSEAKRGEDPENVGGDEEEHVYEGTAVRGVGTREPSKKDDYRSSLCISSGLSACYLPPRTSSFPSYSPVSSFAYARASCSLQYPSLPSPAFSSAFYPSSVLLARNIDSRLLRSLQRPQVSSRFLPFSLLHLIEAQQALRESLWRVLRACQFSVEIHTLHSERSNRGRIVHASARWRKQSKKGDEEDEKGRVALEEGGKSEQSRGNEREQREAGSEVYGRAEIDNGVRIALEVLSLVYGDPSVPRQAVVSSPFQEVAGNDSRLPSRSRSTGEEKMETRESHGPPQQRHQEGGEQKTREDGQFVLSAPSRVRKDGTAMMHLQKENRHQRQEEGLSLDSNEKSFNSTSLPSLFCSSFADVSSNLPLKETVKPGHRISTTHPGTSSCTSTSVKNAPEGEDCFHLHSSLFSRADFVSQTLLVGILEAARRYRTALGLLSQVLCLCSASDDDTAAVTPVSRLHEDNGEQTSAGSLSSRSLDEFGHKALSQHPKEEKKLGELHGSLSSSLPLHRRDTLEGKRNQVKIGTREEKRRLTHEQPWIPGKEETDREAPAPCRGFLTRSTDPDKIQQGKRCFDTRNFLPEKHSHLPFSVSSSSALSPFRVASHPHPKRSERVLFWRAWQRRLHAKMTDASQSTVSSPFLTGAAMSDRLSLGTNFQLGTPYVASTTEWKRTPKASGGTREQDKEGEAMGKTAKVEEDDEGLQHERGDGERRDSILQKQNDGKDSVAFLPFSVPFQMYPFSQAHLRQQRDLNALTSFILRGRLASFSKRRWLSPCLFRGDLSEEGGSHFCAFLAQVTNEEEERGSEWIKPAVVSAEESHTLRTEKERKSAKETETSLAADMCHREMIRQTALQLSQLRKFQREQLARERRRQRWRLRVLLSSRVRTRTGWRGVWGRVSSPAQFKKSRTDRFLSRRNFLSSFSRTGESGSAPVVARGDQPKREKKGSRLSADQQKSRGGDRDDEEKASLKETVLRYSHNSPVVDGGGDASCDVSRENEGRRVSSLSQLICEIEKNDWVLDSRIEETVAVGGLMETARRQRDWIGVLRIFWQLFERRVYMPEAEKQDLEKKTKKVETLSNARYRVTMPPCNSAESQVKEGKEDSERNGWGDGDEERGRTSLGETRHSRVGQDQKERERLVLERAITLAVEAYSNLGLSSLARDMLQKCEYLLVSNNREKMRGDTSHETPKTKEITNSLRAERRSSEYGGFFVSNQPVVREGEGGDTTVSGEGNERKRVSWEVKQDDPYMVRMKDERSRIPKFSASPLTESEPASLGYSLSSFACTPSPSSSTSCSPSSLPETEELQKLEGQRVHASVSSEPFFISSPLYSLSFSPDLNHQTILQAKGTASSLVQAVSSSAPSSISPPASISDCTVCSLGETVGAFLPRSPEAFLNATSSLPFCPDLPSLPSPPTTSACNQLLSSLLIRAKLFTPPPAVAPKPDREEQREAGGAGAIDLAARIGRYMITEPDWPRPDSVTWSLCLEFCYLLRDSSSFFKLLRLSMPPVPMWQPPPLLGLTAGEKRSGDEKRTRNNGEFPSVKTGLRSNISSLPRERPEVSHGVTCSAAVYTERGAREDTARPEKETPAVHTPCLSLLGKPPEERRLTSSLEVGGSFTLPSGLAKKMLRLLDVHLSRNLRRVGKSTTGHREEDRRGNRGDGRGRRVDGTSLFFPLSQEREPTRSGDPKELFVRGAPPINMTPIDGSMGTRPAFSKAIREVQFPLGNPIVRGFSLFPWENQHALSSPCASSELSTGETEKEDVHSGGTGSLRKEACFPEGESPPVTKKRQVEEQLVQRRERKRRTGAIDEEEEEREEKTANGQRDFRVQREAFHWLQVSGLHHFLPKIVEWSEERCSSNGHLGFPTIRHTGTTRLKGLSKILSGRERRDAYKNNGEKMTQWGEEGKEEKDVSQVAAIQVDLRRVHPLLIRPSLLLISPFLVEHFEGLAPRNGEKAKRSPPVIFFTVGKYPSRKVGPRRLENLRRLAELHEFFLSRENFAGLNIQARLLPHPRLRDSYLLEPLIRASYEEENTPEISPA